MKWVYRFKASFYRQGGLEGVFVADDEQDVAPVIGKRADFGEALGKHSQICIDEYPTSILRNSRRIRPQWMLSSDIN